MLPMKEKPWNDAVVVPPIRAIRQAQGISLRELARDTKVDIAQLSRIERGLNRPTVPVLRRLAKALGLKDLERLLRPFDLEDKR